MQGDNGFALPDILICRRDPVKLNPLAWWVIHELCLCLALWSYSCSMFLMTALTLARQEKIHCPNERVRGSDEWLGYPTAARRNALINGCA